MIEIAHDLKALAEKCGRKTIERARQYHEQLFIARKVIFYPYPYFCFIFLSPTLWSLLFFPMDPGISPLSVANPNHVLLPYCAQAHFESRQAAVRFEAVSEMQRKSKAIVKQLELRVEQGATFDEALQARLNQATVNVVKFDEQKTLMVQIHGEKMQSFSTASDGLNSLARARKKSILKAQPYFNCKAAHDRALHRTICCLKWRPVPSSPCSPFHTSPYPLRRRTQA